MTTYNRVDCARINQEIIKLNYKHPFKIAHTCSSDNYQQYIEDAYLQCSPKSLQSGASDLLKQSLKLAMDSFSPEYIVHLEGDTWIMDESIIYDLITEMDNNKSLMIATSAWDEDLLEFQYLKNPSFKLKLERAYANLARSFGKDYKLACRDSLATQFFVIRTTPEMLNCFFGLEPIPGIDLEQALYKRFMSHFNEENILRIKKREPIHPHNRYTTEKLAFYSQHWPAKGTANDDREPTHPRYISPQCDGKRETLEHFTSVRNGKYIQKLLNTKSFDYYNFGASRT